MGTSCERDSAAGFSTVCVALEVEEIPATKVEARFFLISLLLMKR